MIKTIPAISTFNNSNMIKSIPVTNANKSMHPLLLPNINHLIMDNNTLPISNPSISDNNVMGLPMNELSNNNNNNSNVALPTQQYLHTATQSPNSSSSSSITSISTQQPININKSHTLLVNGILTSHPTTDLASAHHHNINPNTNGNTNSTYDTNNGSTQIVKQSIGPTFYNKNLPKTRKRQRLGPSCDTCRSRKVRCNAKIEILYEDDRIIGEISEKLNYVLKPYEADELSRTLLRYHDLPQELFIDPNDKSTTDDKTTNKNQYRLMKHINKIVLFQPCSSCVRLKNHKRRNSYALKWKVDHCSFSKGLTKSDANVFNEIHKITNKPLEEMTVQDFKNTGLVGTTQE